MIHQQKFKVRFGMVGAITLLLVLVVRSRGVETRKAGYPPADGSEQRHEKVARQNCRAQVSAVPAVHRRRLLFLCKNEIYQTQISLSLFSAADDYYDAELLPYR